MTRKAVTKRVCTTCGASDWGSRNRCNPCRASQERLRQTNDPESERAKRRRWQRVWREANPEADRVASRRRRYGLTANAFAAMLGAQGGLCQICGRKDPDCVDHDHETGRVRGILCSTCNAGLGHFRDDAGLMRAAAAYLSGASGAITVDGA
jgi:hypothetical protein